MQKGLIEAAAPKYLSDLHTKRGRVAHRFPNGSAAHFILTKPFEVRVFGTEYRAPSGYATNFASVPWFARWLISVIGPWAEASVIHDAGCDKCLEKKLVGTNAAPPRWQRANLSRREVDRIFLALMLKAGVRRWRATIMYAAVRLYAICRRIP